LEPKYLTPIELLEDQDEFEVELIAQFVRHITHYMSVIKTYNYENNKQDALYRLIYYSKSAVHVSGDVFAHHQEHLTVFTVSCSVKFLPAATWVKAYATHSTLKPVPTLPR
jgi:hypothetical protein